jgi:hypothetical protein
MEAPVTAEDIFDLAVRIQVRERKSLEAAFFPEGIRVILPPKRVLAVSGPMALSQITATLASMEQDHLIETEQRGGMWTTPGGNRIVAGLLAGKYRNEAERILGPVILHIFLEELQAP